MATIRERITRAGEVRYEVQVRLAGTIPRTRRFRRLNDAKRWAQEEEVKVRNKRAFGRDISDRTTLADAITRYCAEKLPDLADSARSRRKALLDVWRDRLGHLRLSDIRSDHLSRAIADLARDGAGPGTQNRYLSAISRVLTFASREWDLIEHNPARDVSRKREPPGRLRYLSREESVRLLDACRASSEPELYPLVLLALATGARFGELVGLRWEHVDREHGWITFERTKNRERRAAKITPPAAEALDHLGPRASGPIFSRSQFRSAWSAALARADIRDFRFHDLRHTTASWMAMSGASLLEVAALLGHKSLAMVRRYAHLSQPHLGEVSERMAEKYLTPPPRDPATTDSN